MPFMELSSLLLSNGTNSTPLVLRFQAEAKVAEKAAAEAATAATAAATATTAATQAKLDDVFPDIERHG